MALNISNDYRGQATLNISLQKVNLIDLWIHRNDIKISLYRLVNKAITGNYEKSPIILKVHKTLFGVDLWFDDEETCRTFLKRYFNGEVDSLLKLGLERLNNLPDEGGEIITSLLVRGHVFKIPNNDLNVWLRVIRTNEPTGMQDDEVMKLEESLKILSLNDENESADSRENPDVKCGSCSKMGACGSAKHGSESDVVTSSQADCIGQTSSLSNANPSTSPLSPDDLPENKFCYQGIIYGNRVISLDDHQKFAKKVGMEWKAVGRQLMKTCRGLEDPVIENIASEHNANYEKAFQMLTKFMQSEGKNATLSRLVEALKEENLCNVIEILLGVQN